MAETKTCPECGSPMPAEAPGGNCPACLLNLALGSRRDDSAASGTDTKARRFGDYELLQKIGDGGMGTVYRARQISLNREVALKLIRAGQLASSQELHRFRMEAEAAAKLDHPNIVPVYEVGEHEGWCYLSMRLVEGQSLERQMARYRQDHRLAPALLAKVARAVHCAHQHGILHRDLKPSNIMLDQAGEPHVTDFGLAKWVDDEQGVTLSGQLLGTPAYMAPEQARGGARRLTTAADVYSLGVVLYELLTGTLPFSGVTPLETLRQAAEQDPKRPSSIRPQVDRELETICLRCLEKEPGQRYASAEALAEELERWLRHEPILARRSRVWGRSVKWVRRHPIHTGLLVVLAIGATVSTWQAVRATRAEQNATAFAMKSLEVTKLLEDLLAGVRPSVAKGRDTTMLREILDQCVERIAVSLTNQPDVEASVLNKIGRTYETLGDYRNAVATHQKALKLFRDVFGPEHWTIAQSLNNLGAAMHMQGDLTGAEPLLQQAIAMRKKVHGPKSSEAATSLSNLAALLCDRHDFRGAEPLLLEAVSIKRQVYGRSNVAVAVPLGNLAVIRQKLGDLAGAEAANREALDLFERAYGRKHTDVVDTLMNLSAVLLAQKQLDEAESLMREAVTLSEEVRGKGHPEVGTAYAGLAEVLQAKGSLEEAESLHRNALDLRIAGLGADHPDAATSSLRLASVLESRGNLAEAEKLHRRALEIHQHTLGDKHSIIADDKRRVARVVRKQGKTTEADQLEAEASQIKPASPAAPAKPESETK